MAQDKKISELTERLADSISGGELIPFADSGDNGSLSVSAIADYIATPIQTDITSLRQSVQNLNTTVSDSNNRIVILSDTEYEALETKDPDKIYYIYED